MRKKTDHAADTAPESGRVYNPATGDYAVDDPQSCCVAPGRGARRGHRWQETIGLYSEALATPGGTDGKR